MTTKPFLYVFNVDEEELGNDGLIAELRGLVAPAEAILMERLGDFPCLGRWRSVRSDQVTVSCGHQDQALLDEVVHEHAVNLNRCERAVAPIASRPSSAADRAGGVAPTGPEPPAGASPQRLQDPGA